ncbi:MAG: nitrogenase component 1 [Bacillota bacterium]
MKSRNFVNLNVNPCKMCMPMGASIAFKGIEGCAVILHGSQGCSTYIRRHMATHYNEPVDIASSCLNEKGTVYGGAQNLKKGLKNVIKLYNPKAIGIATTCLAETIGEDINRIVQDFKIEEKAENIHFVTVPTPGYGASQYEGYYAALRSILEQTVKPSENNEKVNIIVGNISPGSIRHIKEMVEAFGIKYTIFPDSSETLDAPYQSSYNRLPKGGTRLEDIRKMGGSRATIEMDLLIGDEHSPGKYLEDAYDVPLYRCPLPIGMENTDKFIEILSTISNKYIPKSIQDERGRMLDAMVDSHKYNAEGRAAVFGSPEMVYGITKLCLENGIKPCVIATGSNTNRLKDLLKVENYDMLLEDTLIMEDTDFETIRQHVIERKVNILIGHSDGRFIEEKDHIPLVRVGFPVHDRVGAQRKVFVGYKGSTELLDEVTNTLLANKYNTFKTRMFREYFDASASVERREGD